MFVEGEGYAFTLCNQGIGSFVLSDRQGTDSDLLFRNMAINEVGFNNVTWADIEAAVD